ncbi:ABC transporter ATP-binding protein [Clostridium tyrobutyricum]|uniref:ABC transporter ATP-binding protein n=1 Tax=Clostridium tyrobutyricum TaxID=1519 RepID=UPI001C3DD9A2|nr:ABC transporter ATP-binding protein [Clostridium tyrobutyricum]MBV4438238.1 ABC transporter ATP-binding protein/permease [Clostridium tyrobutyricum]
MKKLLQEKFQLTEAGARGLVKSVWSSFAYYAIYMLPMLLIIFFIQSTIEKNKLGISSFLLLIVVVLVIMYLVTNINYKTTYNETYKESANLRIEIADILKSLPLSYFSKHDISDLSQTIMSDVATIEHALSHAIGHCIGYVLFFILIGIMMLVGNYKLGLCVLIPLLLSVGLLYLSKKRQVSIRAKHYIKLRNISERFQSSIEMSQEIKSYGLKKKTMEDIENDLVESEKIQTRAEVIQAFPVSLSGWITKLSIGFTIIVGIYLFINNEVNLLYLIGYIIAATKISEGLEGIYMYLGEIFYLDSRIKRIKELRNTKTQTGQNVEFSNYDISFDNVRFAYNQKNKNVVDCVSFTAKQNQITALIGPSGCGKSTILKLMSRLYDYNYGKITIGGYDIKEVDTECLFKKISVVFQDVVLFNTSIMENIRIGDINASDEEVKRAAKLAGCEEIIEKLPEGYNTLIGENGAKLSGGERQRISIARAMLKDAPIILLDEIAASLDVENESKVQEGLNRLIRNKTVVIISHRLKSIQNVDQIILLNNGKVEAAGTHDEIYQRSKLYRNMIEKSNLTEEYKY